MQLAPCRVPADEAWHAMCARVCPDPAADVGCFRQPIAALRASEPFRIQAMAPRDKDVYFAKLAEQAERYDEMAEHMTLGERRGASNLECNEISAVPLTEPKLCS